MTGRVSKNSGDVSNGVINKSLGRPNPKPLPKDTSSMTVKRQGIKNNPTRFPYNSSKGEIRDHKGL